MEIEEIPLTKLEVDEVNTRSQETEIDESLINSVKNQGVINPLVVRPIEDDKYGVVCGSRRLRAAVVAGLESAPCNVEEDLDDLEARVLSFQENEERGDLGIMERAKSVHKMWNEDLNGEEKAKDKYEYFEEELGMNPRAVRRHKKNFDMPEKVKKIFGVNATTSELSDSEKKLVEKIKEKLDVEKISIDLEKDLDGDIVAQIASLQDKGVKEKQILETVLVSAQRTQKEARKIIRLVGGEGISATDAVPIVKQSNSETRERAVRFVKEKDMSGKEAVKKALTFPTSERIRFEIGVRTVSALDRACKDLDKGRKKVISAATEDWLEREGYYE